MNLFKIITGVVAGIFVIIAVKTGNFGYLGNALIFALASIDSMIQEGK